MSTFPVGSKVRRHDGVVGIVAAETSRSTRLAIFPLGSTGHTIGRELHVSGLELVDAGPHPIPVATAGVVA